MVTTASACSIGSNMIVNALEAFLDPILVKLDLPTLETSPQKVTLLQTLLVVAGYWHQMRPGGAHIPGYIKFILSPFSALELLLSKMMLSKKL